MVSTGFATAAGILSLAGCRQGEKSEAHTIISAMETSLERFSHRSSEPDWPGIWDKEDRWAKKLARLGRPAIAPVVSYHRAIERERIPSWRDILSSRLLRVLAYLDDEAAIPDLMQLANDESVIVSRYAIAGLRKLCTTKDIGMIVELVSSLPAEWDTNRVMLVELLGSFEADPVRDILRRYLADDDPVLRRGAIRAVERSGNKSFLPLMARMLQLDKDEYVRVAAAEAASRLGDKTGTEYLLDRLDPRGPPIEIERALYALVRLGEREAVPKISGLLRHPDVSVRSCASEGLKLMGIPEAARALEEAGDIPGVPWKREYFKDVDRYSWM